MFNRGAGPGGGYGGSSFDWGSAITGGSMLGKGLAGLFGGDKNPYEAGSPFYERIMRELPQYFDPWMSAGKGALPTLTDQFNRLISDPNAMYKKFGEGYRESPGYAWRQKQGQEAALNAAAAGGMAGSPMHQQFAAETAEDIANQDFMNYLASIMQMYGMGMGGLGDISKQGLLGSIGLGEDLASVLSRQAEAAIRGQETENKGNEMDWGNILGGIGSLAGMFMGGPAGGMAGGMIGKGLGGMF